jgi:hypothetical protein
MNKNSLKPGLSLYLDLFRLMLALTVIAFHASFPQIGGSWFVFRRFPWAAAPKIVGPKTFRITPAMATGVTDRLGETGDYVKNSRRSWMWTSRNFRT